MNSVIDLHRFFSSHPLSRDEPLKAWVRFLSWQIKSRLRKELLVPWIEGQTLVIRRGMTGATGNVYVGLHEFVDMMVALHFLQEGDLFLDIGANVGSYTVLASGVCRAVTWAFEPDPCTAERLKRNVAVNHLESLVKIYECALGNAKGEVPFTIGLDTVNRVAVAQNRNVRMVPQDRLDSLVGGDLPIMLKIDVEGYEEEVLLGAQAVLGKPSLKVIEIETITPAVEQLLGSNGFERTYYNPFSRTLDQRAVGLKANNSLYVRDLPFVSRRLANARSIEIFGHKL
jgi:FkbM family methyltransferase